MSALEYCYVRFADGRVQSCMVRREFRESLYDLDALSALGTLELQGWYRATTDEIPHSGEVLFERQLQTENPDGFQVDTIPVEDNASMEDLENLQREREVSGWDLITISSGQGGLGRFMLFKRPMPS